MLLILYNLSMCRTKNEEIYVQRMNLSHEFLDHTNSWEESGNLLETRI